MNNGMVLLDNSASNNSIDNISLATTSYPLDSTPEKKIMDPIEKVMAIADSPDICLSDCTWHLMNEYNIDLGNHKLNELLHSYLNTCPEKFIRFLILFHPLYFFKLLADFRELPPEHIYLSYLTEAEASLFTDYLFTDNRIPLEHLRLLIEDVYILSEDSAVLVDAPSELNIFKGLGIFNEVQREVLFRSMMVNKNSHFHMVLGSLNFVRLQLAFLDTVGFMRVSSLSHRDVGIMSFAPSRVYVEPGKMDYLLIPRSETLHFLDFIAKLDYRIVHKTIMSCFVSRRILTDEVDRACAILKTPSLFKTFRFRNEALHIYTTQCLKSMEQDGNSIFSESQLGFMKHNIGVIIQEEYAAWFSNMRTRFFTKKYITQKFYFSVLDSRIYNESSVMHVELTET